MAHTLLEQPIRDFTWMRQLLTGKIRERFEFEDYRVVAIEPSPNERSSYHFRLLFFPKRADKPVLSLNLETSILGSYCFTEQAGDRHVNLGPSEMEMSYEDFREMALLEADRVLH